MLQIIIAWILLHSYNVPPSPRFKKISYLASTLETATHTAKRKTPRLPRSSFLFTLIQLAMPVSVNSYLTMKQLRPLSMQIQHLSKRKIITEGALSPEKASK